ncbi:hypothetical protein ACLOJK_029197 [Asimina triloba]
MGIELDDGGFEFAGDSGAYIYWYVLAMWRRDVHKLDRESSGILLMGRTKESIACLHSLFNDKTKGKTSFEVSKLTNEEVLREVIAGSNGELEDLIRLAGSHCSNEEVYKWS